VCQADKNIFQICWMYAMLFEISMVMLRCQGEIMTCLTCGKKLTFENCHSRYKCKTCYNKYARRIRRKYIFERRKYNREWVACRRWLDGGLDNRLLGDKI
jgi:hypothetical protein